MPTQAAPREEPTPDAILRAAAVGGVVATGAAGAGAASGPAAIAGGTKVAATGAQVAVAVAAAISSLRGARSQEADWLWLIKPMRVEFPLARNPTVTDDTIARFARLEGEREREFFRRMEDRLRRTIPIALTADDPEAAVNAVLRTEHRFLRAHEEASTTRVHAAIRRVQVKELSPEGAFWRLGALVKEHTPDCVALAAVGWWPWEVLDRMHPPMHPGCACELLTRDEAVDFGLMSRTLPDTSNAVERANEIARAYGIIQEAYWLETDNGEAIAEAVATFAELLHDLGPRPTRMLAPGVDSTAVIESSSGGEMRPAAGATLLELREADDETPKQRTGCMVALYPDSDIARDLSLRDGEHPDTLHVTLGYLGKSTELSGEDAAIQAVRRWAEDCPPLKGEVSGFGYFLGNPDSDGGKVTYASVDLPELPHQRERLVDDLAATGVPPRRDHGFTPHMTLDYASRRPALDKPVPLDFSHVTLVWGENRYSFRLTGKPLAGQIMEGLVDYAKGELERAGLFSKDSDYEGMLGDAILDCVKTFSKAGHSGMSAAMATAALEKLLRYQPLTPLTSDPEEWQDVSEFMGRPAWQSRRNPAAFSYDGGKTWEIMEAPERLPLSPLDLEEVAYDRRYPKGTIYGGRFMPKRGGHAPRVQLKDAVTSILADPKPVEPKAQSKSSTVSPAPEGPDWTKDPPKVYDDPSIQDDAKTWAESLTPAQRASIEAYTEDPFHRDDELEAAARKGELTAPVTAYRAIPGAGVRSKLEFDQPTSFTTNREVAEWDFGDAVLPDDEDFTVLEVELPAGAPMGFPSVGNEMMATQQELLLPSGYRLVFVETNWKQRESGKGRIRLEKVRIERIPDAAG